MICQLRLEKKRKKESETFLLLFKKPSSRLCNSLLSCMDITTPQARQDRIKKLLPSNHSYQLFHNLFHNYLLLNFFFFFFFFFFFLLNLWGYFCLIEKNCKVIFVSLLGLGDMDNYLIVLGRHCSN
jgi:hypothetical protein